MRRCLLGSVAGTLIVASLSTSALALNATSWVAANGSDANACTRASPCATFNQALTQTAMGGTIQCADAGNYASPAGLTITKAVSIICDGTNSEFSGLTGTQGIIIDVPTSDPVAGVLLRGFTINGRLNTSKVAGKGVWARSATSVTLNNMSVTNFGQQGVLDTRTQSAAGQSFIMRDSKVSGHDAAAIVSAVTPFGSGRAVMLLVNVHSTYSQFGVAVADRNAVSIEDSQFFNNTYGIETDSGGGININGSNIRSNAIGILSNGEITVSDSRVLGNTTGILGGGVVRSARNNLIYSVSSEGNATVTIPQN